MISAERRKHSRSKKSVPQTIRISFEERPGHPKTEIVATLVDTSDAGCRIATRGPLGVGSVVYVDRQSLGGSGKAELWSARITWCSLEHDGAYMVGLTLVARAGSGSKDDKHANTMASSGVPDYYELLQVNSKADPDTIHRVYRLLAQRFHPDNVETGDELLFRRLLEAYKVLSDPEQRASYDVNNTLQGKLRWKIFDQGSAVNGRKAEKTKRMGILLVLYTRRLNEPVQPAMTMHEMEDLLGCPREHLEFSLWYMREKGWVARSDNNRFTITAAGVEAAEEAEIPWSREDRLLRPAAAG